MQVTFFHRRPYGFHFSIEKLFDAIQADLSDKIKWQNFTLPHHSQGLLPRLKNAFVARRHQGTINHITGDIHFITPFLSKKRTLNTYHDFTFLKNSKGLSHFILWLFWVYLPVKRSRHITVISEATKQELIKYSSCPADKISVIPNIISSAFKASPKAFNTACPQILHIGTSPNKNLERLIKALDGIPSQLHIIGQLAPETTALLQQHNIQYKNSYQLPEEALRQAYIDCDLLSFCSLNEGFGLPILEAQATGRPVVTSNLSSMPEVAGNAACLVDPYDVSAIRQGIQKVMTDAGYRSQLIEKGFTNCQRFNAKVVAAQYEALYEKIFQELDK